MSWRVLPGYAAVAPARSRKKEIISYVIFCGEHRILIVEEHNYLFAIYFIKNQLRAHTKHVYGS
jgi:hypothetical protein